jgi:hypothetical protein
MAITAAAVANIQIVPAIFQGVGACRNSMKSDMTRPAFTADIAITDKVPASGENIGCENHQVDAAVLIIRTSHTAVTSMRELYMDVHRTR